MLRVPLLLAACHAPPPALPPTGATLDAAVFTARRVAVESPADVVVPAGVGVTRGDVWGTEECRGDRCVLSLVQPGERIDLHPADGAPPDRPIEVRALALPPATAIAVGETVRSTLAPVGDGDPRGPLADLTFALDAPARVVLGWTTEHVGAGPHGAPHQVDARLYGPDGSEQPEVFGQFEAPERHENTWALGAGRYVLRLVPASEPRLACEAYETPFGTTAVPAWCELEDDRATFAALTTFSSSEATAAPAPPAPAPPAAVVVAVGGTVSMVPGQAPEPPTLRIPATRGQDLVVRWDPPESALTYAWKSGRSWSNGACEDHACRFWAVGFDAVDVALGVREAPERVTVTATSLPLPTERIALRPGQVASTTLQALADGDPRGPLLDFALRVEEPGRYRLGVSYPEGTHQPGVHPLGPGLVDTYLQSLSADPYEARWYDVARPGEYPVRVDTCPDCPPVAVQVEWQADAG